MKKISFLILFLFLLCNTTNAKSITANVLQRIFLIKYGDNYGTAFTIEVDNKQYLITAKHNLPNIKDKKDTIELFHDKKWKKLDVGIIKLKNPDVDIAVLAPPIQLSPTLPFEPSLGGVIISQDVFFLGFPYMINFDAEGINRRFPLPFIKKGILSAIDSSDKEVITLYVDGHNNPGFSGGPIVFWDKQNKIYKVGGIIKGYRYEKSKVFNRDIDTGLQTYANTGIIIGHSIKHAIEAIKDNPIGIEIKKIPITNQSTGPYSPPPAAHPAGDFCVRQQ